MDMNANWVIAAHALTTELRSSITRRSIRLSFARAILNVLSPATTATCVPLLTLRRKLQLTYFISFKNLIHPTFTYSTLRQCGAHTVMHLMLAMRVFMRTTGKTFVESLISLIMKENSAPNGRLSISYKLMQTVVVTSIAAVFHMDGKSKNIIRLTTRCTHADRTKVVPSLTAPTITQNPIAATP